MRLIFASQCANWSGGLAQRACFAERQRMRIRPAIVVSCCALLCATQARLAVAQAGSISGVVEDSLGAHIAAVQVAVVGTNLSALTDAKGIFRFTSLRPATYTLTLRRLGYEPVTTQAVVRSSDTASLAIELRPLVVNIEPVVVTGNYTSPRLAASGFDRRRTGSTVPAAQYVTRADIEKRRPFALSQLLLRMNTQTKACIDATIYVDGNVQAPPPRDPPTVVLTAREAAKLGPPSQRPNPLDQIPPEWVEGMEVYVGLAQIPAEFKAPGRTARCVIAIWTR